MVVSNRTRISPPELPHWETPPVEPRAAIRHVKQALRARIERSGRSVEELFMFGVR